MFAPPGTRDLFQKETFKSNGALLFSEDAFGTLHFEPLRLRNMFTFPQSTKS